MNIVRCNDCGWIGKEDELETIKTLAVDCEGRFIDYEQCPKCGSIECIMDVESSLNFNDEQIRELWSMFGDIPINDNDEIEEAFMDFEEGTNRFFVWKWFDQHYSKGVYSLAYNGGE